MKGLSIHELRAAGRAVVAPFRLDVHAGENGEALIVRRVLRLLPGKRLTAEAEWRGQTVVLKLFYAARSAARHLRRERDGLAALRAAGLATPQLLAEGSAGGALVLLLEFFAESQPLSRVEPERQPRQAVLAAIQHMHTAGLVQKDIHPGNFLVCKEAVYCIDGDAVETGGAGRPLPEPAARDNLALFLAQFTLEQTYLWLEALNAMADESLLAALRRQRLARFARYRPKLYRDCTEIVHEQDSRRLLLLRREEDNPALRALLADPDGCIARGTPLKLGRSATVVRCELANGRSVVVKRYNVWAKPWRMLSRAIRPSRAWRSWSSAHLLHFFGLPASKPLAMLEKRFGPFRGTAYFVSGYVEGRPGNVCFEPHAEPSAAVLEGLIRMFSALQALRITLGDTKLSNFLIRDAAPYVWLIDLDDIRLHRSEHFFSRAWLNDRARFLRNFDNQARWREWFEVHLP